MRKNLVLVAALLSSVLSGCAVYPYQSSGYGSSYGYYGYSRPVWVARFDSGPSMHRAAPPRYYAPPPRGFQPHRGFEPGPRPFGGFHGDHHHR